MLCTNTKYNPRRYLTAGQSSTGKERKDSDQDYEATLKKEYLVHYEALVIEKWALPLFQQLKDVTIIEKKNMSRRNFEDASCEICCDPGTMEEQVQSTTDLYQCSATCNRTYHIGITIGCELRVWAAIQMINGLAS